MSSTTIVYDDNGNLTQDQRFKYEYDAWNRLVKVKTAADDLAIGVYSYDARNHRIKKVVTNSGQLDGTTYFYHTRRWQLLETRDGSENLDEQSIWGTQYIDELVRFEKQDYGTMIAFHDHNYNITAITNLAGNVLERITYTPYGQPTYNVATINGDYDADGDIDSSDNTNFTTCKNNPQPVTGACRVFDFDNDGDVDLTDFGTFQLKYTGSTMIYRQPERDISPNNVERAHQGLMLDEETQMYQNRNRQYNANHERFMQRDPLGHLGTPFHPWRHYIDGMSLYAYLKSSPSNLVDFAGTACADHSGGGFSQILEGCAATPEQAVAAAQSAAFAACCIYQWCPIGCVQWAVPLAAPGMGGIIITPGGPLFGTPCGIGDSYYEYAIECQIGCS